MQNFILDSPLRHIDKNTGENFIESEFGAVLSNAGVGKTALLVNIALYNMLYGANVLHISLNEPVKKVCLWYEEVFRNIASNNEIKNQDTILQNLLVHRFIMTFKVDKFDVPKLEERITDLTEQNIFLPKLILIDGIDYEKSLFDTIYDFKNLAKKYSLKTWFTLKINNDDISQQILDMLDSAIQLFPVGNEVHLKFLKGKDCLNITTLLLDTSTMLINKKI